MKSDRNAIVSWSESYLDTLELLYGTFDLDQELTTAEVGEEWQECFSPAGKGQVEAARIEADREWCESYIEVLELLYGEFDLHTLWSIDEVAEEWAENFSADSKLQSAINRRQATPQFGDSFTTVWPLQPAS